MNELTIISRKSTLAKLQAIEVSEVIKRKFPELKIIFILGNFSLMASETSMA